MKIIVLNPNSDAEMTRRIASAIEPYAEPGLDIECVTNPSAPIFIETKKDEVLSAAGLIELINTRHDGTDAFILACHCDPNLDVLKEISSKPVVGIGEASMKIASLLGHHFSVIQTTSRSIPNKIALIQKYHLQEQLASVCSPDPSLSVLTDEEKMYITARRVLEETSTEVIVLGCAGLAGLRENLQQRLNVPVIDGIQAAIIIATGFIKFDYSISKVRRYQP